MYQESKADIDTPRSSKSLIVPCYNNHMKDKLAIILSILILITVGGVVYSNILEENSIDRSKIPEKVELSKGFQKWITNLKNKDFMITADEFRLLEENEIYNTKWMKVYSIDEAGKKEEFESNIARHLDIKKIVYSPSKRAYIDYRYETRDGYNPNEAHYYGLRDDKIIDARILDCSARANCYFDRAYFLDNDVFVISEFSRNIDKKDQTAPICPTNQLCTYSIKIHVIDLVNNSRLIYVSKPFDIVWDEVVGEL